MKTPEQKLNNSESNVISSLNSIFNEIKSIELYDGVKSTTEEELSYINSNSEEIKKQTKESIQLWINNENTEEQNKILKFLNDSNMIQKIRRSIMDSMLVYVRFKNSNQETAESDKKLFVAHQKMKLYGDIRSKYNNFRSQY